MSRSSARGLRATASIGTLLCGVLVCGAVAFFVLGDEKRGLNAIKAKVRRDFPTVSQLSVDQLQARLTETDRPAPLLLDVRRAEEFAVSSLPGARQVDPDADPQDLDLDLDIDLEREIVVYCSVGYRSSRLAARMQEAGFTDVHNLEGSIFEWADRGFPLRQGDQPAFRVHPYSRAWAWLVAEPMRAFKPEKALEPTGEPAPEAN